MRFEVQSQRSCDLGQDIDQGSNTLNTASTNQHTISIRNVTVLLVYTVLQALSSPSTPHIPVTVKEESI